MTYFTNNIVDKVVSMLKPMSTNYKSNKQEKRQCHAKGSDGCRCKNFSNLNNGTPLFCTTHKNSTTLYWL